MKRSILIPILFFSLLFSSFIYSQDRTKVGLSASIQGNQVDIMVPITTEVFSIAPSLGLLWAEEGGTDFHLGLTQRFYLTRGGRAYPYVGGRLGLLMLSPKGGDSVIDYLAGAVCGGEYFLDNHFSFGVEAQLNLTISNNKSMRFGNPGKKNLNTATAVFMTYYF